MPAVKGYSGYFATEQDAAKFTADDRTNIVRFEASHLDNDVIYLAIPYSVSYNANGGSGVPVDKLYVSGDTAKVLAFNGTPLANHRFKGWLSSNDSEIYQADEIFKMPAENVLLTAQWTPVYSVKYALDGGTINGAGTHTDPNFYAADDAVILPVPNPVKDGYIFKGWSYESQTS